MLCESGWKTRPLNNYNKKIFLFPPGSVGKGKGKALPEDKAACQVFVGNLSFRTSWQDLKDHFKHIGDIE